MQWKQKGSCKADSPSDTQNINTAGYMEHQDNVRDRKDCPGSQRNEKIQDQNAWTVWDKVDTVRTAQTLIWWAAAVIRTHWGGSPPYWGCGLMLAPEAHVALISLSTPTSLQPSLPPRRKTSGWTSSSAMLPPMMWRKRRKMTSTNSYKQC